jgi:elongation factor G
MLAEAMLHAGAAIPKIGSVDGGTSVSDFNEDEKERKISINSSVMNLTHEDVKVNLIDVPGYSDFQGEAISGLRAAESVLLVVNAVSGIEIGTERFFKMADQRNMPCAIVISRIDKEHADFVSRVQNLRNKFGKKCAALTFPIGKETSFKGVVDLISKEGMDQLSDEEKDEASKMSEALIESVAESDDALLEKYLESGELSAEEIKGALRKAVIERKLVPVFVTSSTAEKGVKNVLDAVINYMPSYMDAPAVEAVKAGGNESVELEKKPEAPVAAFVFKTIFDNYVGQINVFKVYSGTVKANSSIYNVSTQTKEKISQLYILQGKDQVQVDSLGPGDIGCVAKLKDTHTQNSLVDEKNQVKFKEIAFPEPAISFSIKPKSRSDEDKISTALAKLTSEDSTFKPVRDEQTKELVVSGMGELHLTIMIKRLKQRFGVDVDIGTPKVAYKETITANGDSQYRHKKQSGGAGQFAEVWMKIAPLERGAGFEFVNEVVGGAIPAQFVVSCEKGVKTALKNGALGGYPVVDVQVTVYDGKTHPVDSKDIAFQIAARSAFREAFLKAKPVLLEPIMEVDFTIPDEFMGDVTGSLNSRRGRIMGMEPGGGAQNIKAKVPLGEMYKYVNELKSITQGRATYTMRFSHYEEVPGNLAQNIIAESKKAKEEQQA